MVNEKNVGGRTIVSDQSCLALLGFALLLCRNSTSSLPLLTPVQFKTNENQTANAIVLEITEFRETHIQRSPFWFTHSDQSTLGIFSPGTST